jgi:hypothetical protein
VERRREGRIIVTALRERASRGGLDGWRLRVADGLAVLHINRRRALWRNGP